MKLERETERGRDSFYHNYADNKIQRTEEMNVELLPESHPKSRNRHILRERLCTCKFIAA